MLNVVAVCCCVIVFFPAFQPGDVVRLKSETKEMVACEVDRELELVRCIWFDVDDELQSAWFHSSTLVRSVAD